LESLRVELGEREPLCLLVGGDAFRGFLRWHRPREILDLAHLVVMRRPGAFGPLDAALERCCAEHGCTDPAGLRDRPAGAILFQNVTQLDIASTQVRELIRQGRSPRYLVPDPVLGIIDRAGLYR
ncbi:MAG TPA: nicotinic acid mononucleotide adenylyltransferase, partial [Lamprocystis sp. (in: g-proteobacteria)]|nr:nicotinic acid mononucleotide adenylyltransferase [Lamprocystis sp. (in: g-proteobacteria)]